MNLNNLKPDKIDRMDEESLLTLDSDLHGLCPAYKDEIDPIMAEIEDRLEAATIEGYEAREVFISSVRESAKKVCAEADERRKNPIRNVQVSPDKDQVRGDVTTYIGT